MYHSAKIGFSLAERPLALLPSAALAFDGSEPSAQFRPTKYDLRDGVAIVPVRGAFGNRSHDSAFQGSYESLRSALAAALADPAVRSIVLDIDSAGGDAAGAVETSTYIRTAAARKPVVAFVDGMAASGAYAIASASLELIVSPSATVGSIGVVMLHFDASKRLANFGLKPTLLYSGAFKADGSSVKPLDRGARARVQHLLDARYDNLTNTIGSHRPALGEAGARRSEAGLFVGKDAVSGNFADWLGSMRDALAAAAARAAGASAPRAYAPSTNAGSTRAAAPKSETTMTFHGAGAIPGSTPIAVTTERRGALPASARARDDNGAPLATFADTLPVFDEIANRRAMLSTNESERAAAREAFAKSKGVTGETKRGLIAFAAALGKIPSMTIPSHRTLVGRKEFARVLGLVDE